MITRILGRQAMVFSTRKMEVKLIFSKRHPLMKLLYQTTIKLRMGNKLTRTYRWRSKAHIRHPQGNSTNQTPTAETVKTKEHRTCDQTLAISDISVHTISIYAA